MILPHQGGVHEAKLVEAAMEEGDVKKTMCSYLL